MRGIEELVAARGLALTRFAYLLCGDVHTAKDLVQTALGTVHRRWRVGRGPDHPEAYVRQAILHAYVNGTRRRSSGEVVTASPPDVPVDDPTRGVDARDRMWRVLDRLPPHQRAVLVLRFYEDLDDVAIGRLLGCATATVRSTASRAFATLRLDPELQKDHRP